MDRPEPHLTLMSIVCGAYGRERCCAVCAHYAEQHAGTVAPFAPGDIAELLSRASLPVAAYISAPGNIPPLILEAQEMGCVVIVQLHSDDDPDIPGYAFLRNGPDKHIALMSVSDNPTTRLVPKPVEHYTTGAYIVVFAIGDLKRGIEAARTHGILI